MVAQATNTPPAEGDQDLAPQSLTRPDPRAQIVENFFYKVTADGEIGESQPMQCQSTSPREHETKEILLAEIGELQRTLKGLHVTLVEYETMANQCYERQVIAEKKFSQQGELLDETRSLVELALQEKQKLSDKLAGLEGPSEDLGDDEVIGQTNQLYKDLQMWVEQNYGPLQQHSVSSESDQHQGGSLLGPINVLEDLARCLFSSILSRFIVGTGNPSTSHALRMLDEKVQQSCPSYIQHNWRSATSIAAFLLAKPELESTIFQIVNTIQARYSHIQVTTTHSSAQQLKSLIWRFVEFKSKIERQIPHYYFWWVVPNMAFRSKSMIGIAGDGTSDALVELCLSPILYKLAPGESEPTVVCPALVKVSAAAH